MNDQERMSQLDKDIERLEERQLVARLMVYLSERHMLVCTKDGSAVKPEILELHIDRFLANRGES